MAWYVTAGSGISVTATSTINNVNYTAWSSRGDSLPSAFGANSGGLFQITNPTSGTLTGSGSFTFSGTAGGSGCTVGLLLAYRVNNPGWTGFFPTDVGDISTTSTINTNVPTSGTIAFDDFYGAKDA